MFASLYKKFQADLEDYWHRRATPLTHTRNFTINGMPVQMRSNHAKALTAADHAIPQYSVQTQRPAVSPFQIDIIVHAPPQDPGPPPADPFATIHYTAHGDVFNFGLGWWGNCWANLSSGYTQITIAPSVAEQPEWIARGILNTLFTNYLMRQGFAMLHATALVHKGHALLLMAPHNTGKSTTALNLVMNGGFRLLTDSMVFVEQEDEKVQLTGFPVGRGKLRSDMVDHFPQLEGKLRGERVRDEIKHVIELRTLQPDLVYEQAFTPDRITLCLVQRTPTRHSFSQPATPEDTWDALMENSMHYDDWPIWERNLQTIAPLVEQATTYHLHIGTDFADIRREIASVIADS